MCVALQAKGHMHDLSQLEAVVEATELLHLDVHLHELVFELDSPKTNIDGPRKFVWLLLARVAPDLIQASSKGLRIETDWVRSSYLINPDDPQDLREAYGYPHMKRAKDDANWKDQVGNRDKEDPNNYVIDNDIESYKTLSSTGKWEWQTTDPAKRKDWNNAHRWT